MRPGYRKGAEQAYHDTAASCTAIYWFREISPYPSPVDDGSQKTDSRGSRNDLCLWL